MLKENQKVEIYFKYIENGSVYYREFENSKVLDYFIENNDIIKATEDEIKEYNQKLKNEKELKENISTDDVEFLNYLKEKFGNDYINKTKSMLDSRKNAGRKSKFNEQQIQDILKLKSVGKSMREIAKIFDCGVATVHKLINENR